MLDFKSEVTAPENFAYWIGEEPWFRATWFPYAISFYDARTGEESERSNGWGYFAF